VVDGDAGIDDFASASAAVTDTAADGGLDAIVVARMGAGATSPGAPSGDWQAVLDTHAGITDALRRDALWTRAAAEHAASTEATVRVVTLTDATSAGGRSRAMAHAQLTRSAHSATRDRIHAFSIAVESAAPAAQAAAGALVGHLVTHADAGGLSGAELAVDPDWVGLRSHPTVAGTVAYGGPELPDWLDAAVRRVVGGEY